MKWKAMMQSNKTSVNIAEKLFRFLLCFNLDCRVLSSDNFVLSGSSFYPKSVPVKICDQKNVKVLDISFWHLEVLLQIYLSLIEHLPSVVRNKSGRILNLQHLFFFLRENLELFHLSQYQLVKETFVCSVFNLLFQLINMLHRKIQMCRTRMFIIGIYFA